MPSSRSRHSRPAVRPAYLALACVGFAASPVAAQDKAEDQTPSLGGVTVSDTVIEEQPYKVDRADSPKYTAPLLDTPKSIVVLPSEVIRESGSTSFVEALRMVPGITFGAGEGGNPQGDRPFIRGFDAQGSTFIDGVRSVGGQSREIFAIEQIEVVKGSDSTMGGRGSAGGSINLVSKMPHLGTDARADLSYGTDDYKRATIDANYQVSEVAAIRLNAMWHDADVAERDVVTYNRWGISPSVALGLGTSTRAYVNFYHLESDDIPDPGIPFERAAGQVTSTDLLDIHPADVPRDTFYGLADRDFRKTNVDELLLRAEHDLADTVKLRGTAKYANVKQSYIITQPDDSQGNVQNGRVWRRVNTRWSNVDSMVGQIDLSGTFATGSLEHAFSVGAEASWEQSKRGSYNVNTNVTTSNALRCGAANQAAYNCTTLINPNPYDPWQNVQVNGSIVPVARNPINAKTEATTYSLYALDTITLTDSLLLNLGIRQDWYETSATTIPTTATSPVLTRKDDFLNYQAGLIFKPAANGSIYVSYAKSTTPPGSMVGEGSEGNAIGLATLDDLKAENTKSYEIGTKWEFLDAALGLTFAAFRTETKNARTNGPDNIPLYVGERRIQGFEAGFNGRPLPFWSIFGGYTYMDSEVRSIGTVTPTTAFGIGKPFPNTPKHSFTAWTTFDIAERFQIGGGAIYNSKQYGSFGNVNIGGSNYTIERSIPGYWRFDATASARLTENIDVRVNVQNLTNKRYYDRTYTTHFATIAPGRSAFATVSLKY
ncbi:TonB-dependent receptor [Novosphingobium panipatense]|uniref:Catecholate siderophore receptor n=1 Tax=Novosphingobium panipatense TaxID=428991 RepID=A0ABY1QH62_9SPHN|nr:TonB-dependent siderophore receptor [Novosphingobium panipatense]SMP71471.1 catecholate siderophore receptor [Novosphingobium panipatense]